MVFKILLGFVLERNTLLKASLTLNVGSTIRGPDISTGLQHATCFRFEVLEVCNALGNKNGTHVRYKVFLIVKIHTALSWITAHFCPQYAGNAGKQLPDYTAL
jgi:hypothetical protein